MPDWRKMDLQSYVDQRIEKLESGAEPTREDCGVPDISIRCSAGNEASQDAEAAGFDPQQNLGDFCEMVDAALAEIASRVMEIAEQVAGDNAKLEQELMDSRLAALESAESVMDMALSVRKKTRMFVANASLPVSHDDESGKRGIPAGCEINDSMKTRALVNTANGASSRASMHEVGVAALFRGSR
ncbi:MAG: hypothetical protein C4534_08515 [Gaiellales bacterium]|nr:MAG: hypothetical protein C4534_08515 [Gaiellales bacterium]